MCGSGAGWVQWKAVCLEVLKPRLFAHMYQEARAEGHDLLLNIDHTSQRVPPVDGHKGPIWDPRNVHGHGSARAERVRTSVF